jgi:hypothetical protein
VLYAVLKRFFLLLLLACDWAGDPYFGQCPLSRPLASQEAYCHSAIYRAQLFQTIGLSKQLNHSCLPVTIAFQTSTNVPVTLCSEDRASILSSGGFLYTLMSLQC